MKTTTINNLKAITLAVILTLGSSYAIGAWTEPGSGCTPPNCNTDAPVNTGLTAQTKTGPLTLMHLFTPDMTVTNSDGITPVTVGASLIAMDSSGKVGWSSQGYQMKCLPWVAGAANDRCCKVNVSTGAVICKEGTSPNGFTSSWSTNSNPPFSAGDLGTYSIEMVDAVAGYRGVILCRMHFNTGSSECKTSSAGYGWSIAGPWGALPANPF